MANLISRVFLHAHTLRWKYSEICNKENCPHVGAKEKCSHVARKDKCIPYQLQRLFLQLQTVDKRAVETTDVTKSFGWDSSEGKKVKEKKFKIKYHRKSVQYTGVSCSII